MSIRIEELVEKRRLYEKKNGNVRRRKRCAMIGKIMPLYNFVSQNEKKYTPKYFMSCGGEKVKIVSNKTQFKLGEFTGGFVEISGHIESVNTSMREICIESIRLIDENRLKTDLNLRPTG